MYFAPAFFLIYVAYAALNPYLPILLRFSGYSPSTVGILLGVFEAAGLAGPFIFGFFADKSGRYKPGLILTHVMILLTLFPLLLFRNPLITGLLVIFMGAGFRSAFPLLDAAATIAMEKTGDYGKVRTAGSVSFVLMMLFFQFTPFLPPDNPRNITWWIGISTVLSLASMILIPGASANTRGFSSPAAKAPEKRGKTWTSLLTIGLLIIGISRLAMASINSFFSLFIVEYMQWNAVGFMWALASVSEIPFMFLSRRLVNRFGALPILTFAAAMVTVRLSVYAIFPYKGGIIAAQLLHSLCYGLFHPAAISFISSAVPPERRALGMSLYLSLGSGLPNLIGSILGGFIVEHAGYRALFGIFALFPIAALGLYFFVAKNSQRGYS